MSTTYAKAPLVLDRFQVIRGERVIFCKVRTQHAGPEGRTSGRPVRASAGEWESGPRLGKGVLTRGRSS